MKNENEINKFESEFQNEINKRLQDLIDRKKAESEALRKMLDAILENEQEGGEEEKMEIENKNKKITKRNK